MDQELGSTKAIKLTRAQLLELKRERAAELGCTIEQFDQLPDPEEIDGVKIEVISDGRD